MFNLNSGYGQLESELLAVNKMGGKVFVVSAATGAGWDKLSQIFVPDPDGDVRLYSTIADALTATVSGRGDYVYVMPGTYTITTQLTLSKDGVHLIGLGNTGEAILTGSASNIMTITGDGVEVAGFTMNLASTKKAIAMTGADKCRIHDNIFLSAVGGAASHFIHMVTTACNYNDIRDNKFISNLVVSGGAITQTSHITGLGIGNTIEHNLFVAGRVSTANAGAVTDGVVFAAAADAGNLVRWNSFTEFNGATFTAGVNYGTTALGGSVLCVENNFMLATDTNAVVNGSNAGNFANNIASGTV